MVHPGDLATCARTCGHLTQPNHGHLRGAGRLYGDLGLGGFHGHGTMSGSTKMGRMNKRSKNCTTGG